MILSLQTIYHTQIYAFNTIGHRILFNIEEFFFGVGMLSIKMSHVYLRKQLVKVNCKVNSSVNIVYL